ncbi:fatty acyl-CoA reductase 3-like isoform X1 [Amaranthus tricolor]|uniref:fatty acyl-CoA reductase 3-like isoform X1 n=1 Tax=Amaranthus tricolor TaxID=29722 RepID=UPI00258C2359|nr:fatty acyl-CoA reductase 3-like isoform X1 [Amaranthus tricolor]
MDFGSINKFLENKTIFVTGATGFIAKILIEKILRTQPNVKKLYLLVRAKDATTANTRLREEVLGKELFKVLREKLGASFEGFMLEKLSAVAGDTSYDNLGLTHHQLNQMYEDIDIVINVAATTKFWERYDVALGVNTLGPKHVVNFANNCSKIQLLIHVSTAYVCGEKKGLISEKPYEMGETLNGVSGLDIDFEKKLIDHTLKNLKAQQLQEKDIRQRMKDLGSQRAKYYGWPNTYVFTKAMGEMLIGKLRGNLPVVILRPTIVCSTFKEPFPGWVEGCRTIDSVTTTYGKGRLTLFLADNSTVLDLIPADMFVNSMIVAIKAHVNNSDLTIYQVGSSYRNPLTFKETHEFHYHYFARNPWTSDEGKSIKLGKGVVLNNILTFQIILFVWQFLVQMILIFTTRMGCSNMQHRLYKFDKKLKIVTKLVDLYKPYLFFKGIFEDTNTKKLLINARENGLDEDMFNFDCECINWEDYFMNVHLPSVVKYLF